MIWGNISEQFGNCLILAFLVGIPVYAHYRKVPVYETFVQGAREGFPLFLRIMPYMVGMLVAIGMLRASGAFDLLNQFLMPFLTWLGIPPEIVPIAIIRPFSGSGAIAAAADIIHTQGANSVISHMATVVAGTTETTFYIIAIYFGAVNIRNNRHAIAASLLVDVVGILTAVWICRWLLQ
jgi:spore maturation protein B